MAGMGSIFFLLGGIILGKMLLHKKRAKYLKTNGTPIQAEIIDIEHLENVSVNGTHPYRIVCYWTDFSGEKQILKSHYLWVNPERFINQNTIKIYIDPNKPKHYIVDTSFMPKGYM